MPLAATRGDGLRVMVSGVEQKMHQAVGTVDGVAILAAGGRNGPGVATIRVGSDGRSLQWKAPGSPTFGAAVPVTADGDYLVEDGVDPNRWARVRCRTAFMPGGPAEARTLLGEVYNNGIASDDVDWLEAFIGDTETYTVTLLNASPIDILALKVWISTDADPGLEISSDGAVWVAPDNEFHADVLTWARTVSGGTVTLHLRRTIDADSNEDPSVLRMIEASWDGM